MPAPGLPNWPTPSVTPNPNLWFIYDLPLFFIATKLAHHLRIPNWVLWVGAALLQTFPPHTGWEALDDYGAHYYVFFLTGYMLAPKVFQLAAWARENAGPALSGCRAGSSSMRRSPSIPRAFPASTRSRRSPACASPSGSSAPSRSSRSPRCCRASMPRAL